MIDVYSGITWQAATIQSRKPYNITNIYCLQSFDSPK